MKIVVGNKVNLMRVISAMVFVIFISALFTGFGYQPIWLFLLIVIIGLLITLPVCFNSYWIIKTDGIEIVRFDKNEIIKLEQLLEIKRKEKLVIKYVDISSVKIEYKKKRRNSPFDVTNDYFRMIFTLKDNQNISLPIESSLDKHLVAFTELLSKNDIKVIDPQGIIKLVKHHENLFEHFNTVN